MDASTQRANLDIHSQLLGLPLGFHFSPSDEELVAYFLVKKLRGEEADFLPFVFNDARAMDFHPAALPDSSYFAIKEHEWYFFVPGKRSRGRPGNRRAGSGYWKASVSGDVMSEGEKVGKKRTYVFYEGEPGSGTETHWVMEEYVIEEFPSWVCCRIRDSFFDSYHPFDPCGVCGRT